MMLQKGHLADSKFPSHFVAPVGEGSLALYKSAPPPLWRFLPPFSHCIMESKLCRHTNLQQAATFQTTATTATAATTVTVTTSKPYIVPRPINPFALSLCNVLTFRRQWHSASALQSSGARPERSSACAFYVPLKASSSPLSACHSSWYTGFASTYTEVWFLESNHDMSHTSPTPDRSLALLPTRDTLRGLNLPPL